MTVEVPYGPETYAVFGDLVWVMDAEEQRGNPPRISLRDPTGHGEPPWARCTFPLDREAIEAEFELAPHIGWSADGRHLVDWDLDRSLWGGTEEPRRPPPRHRRWWKQWQAAPRPRRRIGSPFDESVPVTTADEAERKLRRHLRDRGRVRVRGPQYADMFPQVRGHDGYYVSADADGVWHTGVVEDAVAHTVRPHASLDDAVAALIDQWRATGLVPGGPE